MTTTQGTGSHPRSDADPVPSSKRAKLAFEDDQTALPRLTLTYGDETRLSVAIREADFECHAIVRQRLALVTVNLTVCNEETPGNVQAALRLPLPAGALVCGYRLQEDGCTFDAVAVPKVKAAAVAYVERERRNHVSTAKTVQANVWEMAVHPLPWMVPRRLAIVLLCKLHLPGEGERDSSTFPGRDEDLSGFSVVLRLPFAFATTVGRVSVVANAPEGSPSLTAEASVGPTAVDTSLPDGLTITLTTDEPSVQGSVTDPGAQVLAPAPAIVAAEFQGVLHWSGFVSSAELEHLLPSAPSSRGPSSVSSAAIAMQEGGVVPMPGDSGGAGESNGIPRAPLPERQLEVGIAWDASRSSTAAAWARLALLEALDEEYRKLGCDVAYTVFTFDTGITRIARQATAAVALEALRAVQHDGGTDLSLLDDILGSTPRPAAEEGVGGGEKRTEETGFACFVLLTDGLDNLPGKRLPKLEQVTVPVHVPLPAAETHTDLTVLQWLAHHTGGVCAPLRSPALCASAIVGQTPQTNLTSLRTDLSSDLEILASDAFVTVPDHRLYRISRPLDFAAEGLWVSGTCDTRGCRRPRTVTLTVQRGQRRAELVLRFPEPSEDIGADGRSARLLAVQHAALLLEDMKLQLPNPAHGVHCATELACRYGLATENSTLLLLREPKQFAVHNIQCPEEHPAHAQWQGSMSARTAALLGPAICSFVATSPVLKGKHDYLAVECAHKAEVAAQQKLARQHEQLLKGVRAIQEALKREGLTAGYTEYFSQSNKRELSERPSFFILAAEALRDAGASAEVCTKVVSNVLELKLQDAQTCRVVAYHLLSISRWTTAIQILELVLELVPREPQSHTDLAFARFLQLRHTTGYSSDWQDRAHQAAQDDKTEEEIVQLRQVTTHLVTVLKGQWEPRFCEIEWPCLILLSWVVSWAEWRWPERFAGGALWPEAELPAAEYRLSGGGDGCGPGEEESGGTQLRIGMFVWLGWDTDHTDVDLHVKEPGGEEVYYSNKQSSITGAELSRDFTDGYGPEVYTCIRAPKGAYRIQTHYFGSRQDSTSTGGTSAVIWSIQHLGDFKRERIRFSTVRLVRHKEKQTVLTLVH
eukprot:gene381-713_t